MDSSTSPLNNDTYEMHRCTSVFTTPDFNQLLLTQFLSFPVSPVLALNNNSFQTDIMLNEDIIIEAIHEISPYSAAGPYCVPYSLLLDVF